MALRTTYYATAVGEYTILSHLLDFLRYSLASILSAVLIKLIFPLSFSPPLSCSRLICIRSIPIEAPCSLYVLSSTHPMRRLTMRQSPDAIRNQVCFAQVDFQSSRTRAPPAQEARLSMPKLTGHSCYGSLWDTVPGRMKTASIVVCIW